MIALISYAKKAAETVGFLATCWAICVGIEFAQFFGGQ